MSLLFDQGASLPDEPSITETVSDLIALPDVPVLQSFGSESEPSGDLLVELSGTSFNSEEPDSRLGALVEDNLPPLLSAAFAADSLHNAELLHVSSFRQSELRSTVTLDLVEDEPFAILLDQLFGVGALVQDLTAIDGPAWLAAGLVQGDATLAQKVVVQTQLQTSGGDRLFSDGLSSLMPGSEVAAIIDVSDTRLHGLGLIGLEGDLSWNPEAATVLSIDLADTLPLFRRTGDVGDWADGYTTLVAAALPKAGAGEALGDSSQELFAKVSLRINDPMQPLNLQFNPQLYPAVGRQTISADQLLNLGVNPQQLPLLQGQPLPDFTGSVELQLQISLSTGESWIQPLAIFVAPRNDAPQVIDTLLELEPISEDAFDPAGARVDAVFADVFGDVDGDQLTGVAITHVPVTTGAGVWQFSQDDQSWQTLNSALKITEASALVLLSTDRLRFLPEQDWSSDQPVPPLSLRLIDSSRTITSAGRVDARNPAADSAFSVELLQLGTRVTPVNDAPQAGPSETPLFRGREGKPFSVSLPDGLFVDPDPTDVLSFSLSAAEASRPVPAWLVIDAATGRLSGVPTEADPDPFTLLLVAADSSGAEVSREIRLLIRPVDPNNHPPQAAPSQRLELLDTEQRVLHLAEIFQDSDPGDILDFTVEIPAAQVHWIAFDPETADLVLQPGLADVTAPAADVQLTLTATDRDGESAVQLLSIAVLNTNQAPIALEPSQPRLLRVVQGDAFELDLQGWFTDPDLAFGDNLSFSLHSSAGEAPGEGALAWLQWADDVSLVGQPGNQDVGALDLVVTATDLDGLTAEQQVRLVIDNVNDVPQLTDQALSSVVVDENTPLSLNLGDWFADLDAIHGQSFRLELTGRGGIPAWLNWDQYTGILSGTPSAVHLGTSQLTLRATDELSISTHTFRIEVDNVNDAPELQRSLGSVSVLQDSIQSIDLSGVIMDRDPGDLLRYSISIRDAAGIQLSAEESAWIRLKTSAENSSEYADRLVITPVLRSVVDGRLLSAEEVSVLPVGSEIDVEIQIEDNRIGVSLSGLIGADLDLSWNPTVLQPVSTDSAVLRKGLSRSLPLFQRVTTAQWENGRLGLSAAAAPAFGVGEAVGDQLAEHFATVRMRLLDQGLPVVLKLAVNSEDLGGLGLGWQEESDADVRLTLGSFSSSDRLDLDLTPGNAQVGRYKITLAGTDLSGLLATTGFELDVVNVNDAPVVTLELPDELMERQAYRLRLADYFSDPDLIHGDRLSYQLMGGDVPSWVSLSTDQQSLELDVPAVATNQSLALALAAFDRDGAAIQQELTLSLKRKLFLGLDEEQRQWIVGLDSANVEQRAEVIQALRTSLQSLDAKERGFQPLQQSLQACLDQSDRAGSSLALQEVLLIDDWLKSQDEYVTQLKQEGDVYVFTDVRSVLDSVRALPQSLALLQSSSNALSYQALLEPINFFAEAERGFSVVTIALPPNQALNSLVKMVSFEDSMREDKWVAAPFAVRTLDLASLRADALQAGLSPAAYQDLLDERLNLFRLHRYPTGEAVAEIQINPNTDLLLLSDSSPREQLDGSALLIDFDGDGVHDVARLLLLDGGFFDNDKGTVGRIDDPLFLANAMSLALQPPRVTGGGSSGAEASATPPVQDRSVTPTPSDPSSPDSGSVVPEPAQPDVTPPYSPRPLAVPESTALGGGSRGVVYALRRSAGFGAVALGTTATTQSPNGPSSLRSALLNVASGGSSQSADDHQSVASGSTVDVGFPPPQENATQRPSLKSKRNLLAPLVQTLQRGFDALAEMDLVDYLALAAMVLPLTAQAGLQGGKQVKPFRLRLRKGDTATESMQSLVYVVFGESPLDPLSQVWIEQTQGRIRILNSPVGEEPDAVPQVYDSSQLWLWQRVRHTARPGELVASCRQALQTIEREGLEGSGLDREAWLTRTLDLHQSQRGAAVAFVSNLDLMVQLLGCLASLGYSYESVVR